MNNHDIWCVLSACQKHASHQGESEHDQMRGLQNRETWHNRVVESGAHGLARSVMMVLMALNSWGGVWINGVDGLCPLWLRAR
jgi:hypothetical protein